MSLVIKHLSKQVYFASVLCLLKLLLFQRFKMDTISFDLLFFSPMYRALIICHNVRAHGTFVRISLKQLFLKYGSAAINGGS